MSHDTLNEMFTSALSSNNRDLMDKVAEETGMYIQDYLRENAFTRKILPPQTVTASDLTRSLTHEGLQYIDDIEPDSVAMTINLRGEPSKTYIQGKRYAINMFVIASEIFQKTEEELLSYKMPILKVVEQNTVKDLQEQVDLDLMKTVRNSVVLATMQRKNLYIDRGLSATQRNIASPAALAAWIFNQNETVTAGSLLAIDTATLSSGATLASNIYGRSNIIMSDQTYFNKTVVAEMVKTSAQRGLKLDKFLLHESDWADVLLWDTGEAGLEVTSEITKDGYKYLTVGGYTYITTVRDNPDIIKPGQIFGFPNHKFLGRYLILDTTKFMIDKHFRDIQMMAWEHCGLGFGNIKGIVCCLLAGASIDFQTFGFGPTGAAITSAHPYRTARLTNVRSAATVTLIE